MWPEQVIDYKALVGDSSDNYPGIVGIGPKTAVQLIEEFGSFEEIVKNLVIRKLSMDMKVGNYQKDWRRLKLMCPSL